MGTDRAQPVTNQKLRKNGHDPVFSVWRQITAKIVGQIRMKMRSMSKSSLQIRVIAIWHYITNTFHYCRNDEEQSDLRCYRFNATSSSQIKFVTSFAKLTKQQRKVSNSSETSRKLTNNPEQSQTVSKNHEKSRKVTNISKRGPNLNENSRNYNSEFRDFFEILILRMLLLHFHSFVCDCLIV